MFDNATGIGWRAGAKVTESRLFSAFKLHYRCQARYCNPYSGSEKGNVENAVGFLRRNLMVPEPVVASVAGFNQVLLARCDQLATATHWRKGVPVGQLFAQDIAASLALPGVGFDPVRYESRTADKTGNLLVEGNSYAAGSVFHGRTLTVGLRHDVIEILDENAQPVVTFPRVFGHSTETVFDPVRLVPLLVRKPGAWGHSPLRSVVPEPLKDWLDAAAGADRRRMLSTLQTTAEKTGFEPAVRAAEALIRRGEDPDSTALGMLARRIAQGEPAVKASVGACQVFCVSVAGLGYR